MAFYRRSWESVESRARGHSEFTDRSFCSRQLGQYQGAGVLTGFGLRLRHMAQRKRLPLTAVFGRIFLPVLGKFFAIGASSMLRQENFDSVSGSNLQQLLDFFLLRWRG